MDPNSPISKPPPSPEFGPVEPPAGLLARIRARILSGLFLALPILVTVWLIVFTYGLLRTYLLDPLMLLVGEWRGEEAMNALPLWWRTYVAPVIAVVLLLTILYLLGLFVRSRLYRLTNRIFLRVPIVTTIYRAVLNVFEALETQRRSRQFKRVVLVEFPHPGMRSIGLVTNSLSDPGTGRAIACVVVLTGVMPPSGFTLFVPEESLTDIDWTLNQALQAIVSGGITAPRTIGYDRSQGPPA